MNRQTHFLLLISLAALLFVSCKQVNKTGSADNTASDDTAALELKYAKGFRVTSQDNYRLVEIENPQEEEAEEKDKIYRFALVPRGSKPQGIPSDYTIIETPVKGVICMTSLQLSGFLKLRALNQIVGIASAKRRNLLQIRRCLRTASRSVAA